MKFPEYLKTRREELGISQWDLAQKFGFSTAQFVSNVERGIGSWPAKKIGELAECLDCSRTKLVALLCDQAAERARVRIKKAVK